MLFLSYSVKDKDCLLPLVGALKALGVDVWFDRYKIEPGASLLQKISEGLTESDRLLVAWSRNANVSQFVQDELSGFYALRPKPPFILFMRLDDTPIKTIFGGRRYLRFTDDVDAMAQAIVNWINGQPGPQIHEDESKPPSPEFLHRFPRGPRVPFQQVTDELIYAYAEALNTVTHAQRIINKANQMREQADPGDSTVTFLSEAFLPTFGNVGAYAYWQEVFRMACLKGPRMLGALLLAQPDDMFDDKARSDRARLLRHLYAMNNPETEVGIGA